MSFRLLTLGSLHQEYINQYYLQYPSIKNSSFKEQYDHLLSDNSETIISYTKMFGKLGINAICIIENAEYLQKQWASENGVKLTDNKEIVFKQIKDFHPDVLRIEDINLVEKNWIKNLRYELPGIRLVIATHCAPYNSKVLTKFKDLNFVITCTPGLKNDFEKNGLKSFLVYHGFDPAILGKLGNKNPFPKNDFIFSGSLFVGGGFHNKRIELIENFFKEKIDLKIYGKLETNRKIRAKQSVYYAINLLNHIKMGRHVRNIPFLNQYEEYGTSAISPYSNTLVKACEPPVFGLNMLKLLKNAKITLNNHGEVAGDYAGNMRLFEATGVGSCLITDNKKNMSDLFRLGEEVVVYDSSEDCIEKVKWLLENENERKKIAKSGQNRTLKTHTVEERCIMQIDIISKELTK